MTFFVIYLKVWVLWLMTHQPFNSSINIILDQTFSFPRLIQGTIVNPLKLSFTAVTIFSVLYSANTNPNESRPLFGCNHSHIFFYLCTVIYQLLLQMSITLACTKWKFYWDTKDLGYLIQTKFCCGHSEWCDSKKEQLCIKLQRLKWELLSCWKKHCGCWSLWGKHFWLLLTTSCPIKPRELDQMWLRTV